MAEGTTRRPARRSTKHEGVFWQYKTLWIRFYVTNATGKRAQKWERTDATTPREAAKIRTARMAAIATGEQTIRDGTGMPTVADALAAVLAEYEQKDRASLDSAKGRAKAIEAAYGANTLAIDVADKADAVIAAWKRAKLKAGGINRRNNLLRRGLNLLVRKRRLAFVPYIPRLDEPKHPARYIPPADRDAIASRLPAYVVPVFRLALLLGIRRGQLSRTLRRYVDLDRGVIAWPPAECKHREPHTVPLDADALAFVEPAMDDARTWCPYMLHGPRCAPGHTPSKRYGCVGDFKKAFRAVVIAAGLPYGRQSGGVIFHGTRATAATDMMASGEMEESDVMAVVGWQTHAMLGLYNLGDVEKLRERLAVSRQRRGKVVPLRRRANG